MKIRGFLSAIILISTKISRAQSAVCQLMPTYLSLAVDITSTPASAIVDQSILDSGGSSYHTLLGYFTAYNNYSAACFPSDANLYRVIFTVYDTSNANLFMSLVSQDMGGGTYKIYVKGVNSAGTPQVFFSGLSAISDEPTFLLQVGSNRH